MKRACGSNERIGVGTLLAILLTLATMAWAGPQITLVTPVDWQRAMGDGSVRPAGGWDEGLEALYPNQAGNFRIPRIMLLDNFTPPNTEQGPGLLMEWSLPGEPGDLIGAWVYQYGQDPDLTGQQISIDVYPPPGITSIGLGLKDINGLTKAWGWTVSPSGPLFPGVTTHIILDPSQGAGQAGSTSYAMSPGFDLTKVVGIIFSEQGNWLNFLSPSPLNNPSPWNYWKNLVVSPIPSNKWAQPPYRIGYWQNKPLFYGWDEPSYESPGSSSWNTLRLADDWQCTSDYPVTDIHWWGSYVGWMDMVPPPVTPAGYRLEIYNDVPANAANPYSHPGALLWQYTATGVPEQFYGYDKDPYTGAMDSCFNYTVFLPTGNWFYQTPGQTGIYWLCITPIYSPTATIQNSWGWKTRPKYFMDDAVRETSGAVPWTPIKPNWDLAFELTTLNNQLKWSQPPVQITGQTYNGKPVYNGWDEPGVEQVATTPVKTQAADDWRCSAPRPVTGIDWWGSYPGWIDLIPPQSPDRFWFGIYTDQPAGLEWPTFSQPKDLIWQYETDNYTQQFAGYDTTTVNVPGSPTIADSCFKYGVTIPKPNWFWQKAQSTHPLADDWRCTTQEPVRDIHWWGSYVNWHGTAPPNVKPIAFDLRIYTDVPVSPNNPYSHPGSLAWQFQAAGALFTEQLVGYDRDPHTGMITDSTFYYSINLPTGSEFYQQGTNGVYWLAILPIYSPTAAVANPWGWKTSKHYFMDDAVRQTSHSPWWEPIEAGWDLAFQLTTAVGKPPKWDQPPVVIGKYKNLPLFSGWDELPPNIFWLSIVGKFDTPPQYPWGWKTRPHFWNDDAVRRLVDTTGNPYWQEIWGPDQKSWDLSFVLRSLPKLILHVTPGDFSADPVPWPITVKLRDTAGIVVRSEDFVLTANSQDLILEDVEPGFFDVFLECSPHWLTKALYRVNVGEEDQTFAVTLLNGDCDGNNAVNAADLSIVVTAMDRITGDPDFDLRADLDGDGEVTSTDLSILAANMDRVGDP